VLAKVMNYCIDKIKYSNVFYEKILVNVGAYVIPHRTHTYLISNYICSHIYQDFIITTHFYIVFYHFNNS